MKRLLRSTAAANKRQIACATKVFVKEYSLKAATSSPLLVIRAPTILKLPKLGDGYHNVGLSTRCGRVILNIIHLVFGFWGVVVLSLHIQASVQRELPQCLLQVHPWAVSIPACYLAVLDCHVLGISGKTNEVEAQWSTFDRLKVATLVIRHCPTLEIPDMIGDFHSNTGVKVYDSTIKDWGLPLP
ncbi:unnamed protein product [Phytophthora lilii]|uniref:Unnamed protein product n=1 Tax=Phytophthora lilii TaxID=2077276 RepID=A0A9W6TDY6_9STRA|nr:unnamed protein product [Phytophthora lilii]